MTDTVTLRSDEVQHYVKALGPRASELSDWEWQFVADMARWVGRATPMQSDKLREIAARLGVAPLGLSCAEEDLWR